MSTGAGLVRTLVTAHTGVEFGRAETERRTGRNQSKTNQAHRLRKRHCWPIRHIHYGRRWRSGTCSLETTGAAGAAPAGGGDSVAAATATAAAAKAADQADPRSCRSSLTPRWSPSTRARQSKGRRGVWGTTWRRSLLQSEPPQTTTHEDRNATGAWRVPRM